MIENAVYLFAFLAVGAGLLLASLRALVGPTDFDRAVALDAIFLLCVALVLLWSLWGETTVYYDLALVLALLGFIVTMAVSRYLGERHVRQGR